MKIYCLGIGGAGVSALARLLKAQGHSVSGSDVAESAVTRALRQEGILVTVPQATANVPLDADRYIYSDAIPDTNPERATIQQGGLATKEVTYFQALGQFMQPFPQRIAVSGTHGKTTTTAMLTLVLAEAGLDPTALIGSTVKALGSNIRYGKTAEYFAVEACEHNAHMLELCPNVIVLTNIEPDHLDYYRDLEHIQATFQKYISTLPADGSFIQNLDDPGSAMMHYSGRVITYGINHHAQFQAKDIVKGRQRQTFQVNGVTYTLNVPGDFNIANALAVIAYATSIGVDSSAIQTGLAKFTGTWRRFDLIGTYHEVPVISDYAHHPTAITHLIKAARERYPQRRVVLAFQPHQHNRTKNLFQEFIPALATADLGIIQEIFDVAGREAAQDQTVSSRDLVAAIQKTNTNVYYSLNHTQTKQLLAEHIQPSDVVLIAGAGDIYTIAEDLCSTLSQ